VLVSLHSTGTDHATGSHSVIGDVGRFSASNIQKTTMSDGTIGILIFLGISGVVAAVTHWFYRWFIIACLLSAFVATLLFQIAAFLHLGYLEPFFPIAVAVGGSISFVIALVVGTVVRRFRRGLS